MTISYAILVKTLHPALHTTKLEMSAFCKVSNIRSISKFMVNDQNCDFVVCNCNFLLQPPPPLVKTVWEERPSSRQGNKSGQSLGSAMTKVGGTPKRNKTKSPARSQLQNVDVSATWTRPDTGLEVATL